MAVFDRHVEFPLTIHVSRLTISLTIPTLSHALTFSRSHALTLSRSHALAFWH